MITKTPPTHRDVITVVRDPKTPLGKAFAADGSKAAQVLLSLGIARQYKVPDAQAMAKLLKEVGQDPHAAIINAGFPAIELDQDFLILSENLLRTKLHLSADDERPTGVHKVKHANKQWTAVGRFKENVSASTWQLLDRDVDEHTPSEFAEIDHDGWLKKLESIFPGLAHAAKVSVPSSSSRVFRHNQPVSRQNTHTWVQLSDPSDVERMRGVIKARCIDQGMHWPKPRYSRADPSQVVGSGIGLPIDDSVWVRGRLVFCGKPTVPEGHGFTVRAIRPTVHEGKLLDTSSITAPDLARLNRICATANGQMQWKVGANGGFSISAHDLTLQTMLELSCGRLVSVQSALGELQPGAKLRCQTPFRASSSVAAFLSRGQDGKPFVYDSGTGSTHWLCDEEAVASGFAPSHARAASLQEVIEHLEHLSDGDVDLTYPDMVCPLSSEDKERFYDWLRQKRPGISKALFNAAMSAAGRRIREVVANKVVGKRHKITVRDEDVAEMARKAEQVILQNSTQGTLVQWGGVLAQIREEAPDDMHAIDQVKVSAPKQVMPKVLNAVDIRAVVERYAVFQRITEAGVQNVGVPGPVLDTLFRTSEHLAPVVRGVVNHPLVVDKNYIVNGGKLDERTQLFFAGEPWADLRPYTKQEAKRALQRIEAAVFPEFAFKDLLDRDVAIAMLFTAIQRRILPIAPGFALLAHIQSSGKTTLARVIHLVATGRELPVVSFPEGDEAEADKRVTAILLNCPAMVVLDNLTDGITFQSSVIARALTSPTTKGRILGESREAVLPTNTLWVLTGNNLSLGADEASRFLPIWLDAKTARPHQRQFKHADLHTHVLNVREQVIRDVIGVVLGYLKAPAKLTVKTRFPAWDLMVRQSLIWAGGRDVQDAVEAAVSSSGTGQAEAAALTCLLERFVAKDFTATDVISEIPASGFSVNEWATDLTEALGRLRCKDPRSPTSLGRALRALVGRPVITTEGTLTLRDRVRDGKHRYRIDVT